MSQTVSARATCAFFDVADGQKAVGCAPMKLVLASRRYVSARAGGRGCRTTGMVRKRRHGAGRGGSISAAVSVPVPSMASTARCARTAAGAGLIAVQSSSGRASLRRRRPVGFLPPGRRSPAFQRVTAPLLFRPEPQGSPMAAFGHFRPHPRAGGVDGPRRATVRLQYAAHRRRHRLRRR